MYLKREREREREREFDFAADDDSRSNFMELCDRPRLRHVLESHRRLAHILCSTILYYTIPYHTIPFHTILYYTTLYCTILYYTIHIVAVNSRLTLHVAFVRRLLQCAVVVSALSSFVAAANRMLCCENDIGSPSMLLRNTHSTVPSSQKGQHVSTCWQPRRRHIIVVCMCVYIYICCYIYTK